MRKIFIASFCFLLLFATTAHAETAIGVFNLQEVANKSDALKAAIEKMHKEYDGKKKELDDKRLKVEKHVTAMGAKPTKQQQDEFVKLRDDYNEFANLYVQNIRAAELEVRKKVDAIIITAAQNVAKAKKLDLVLDSAAAIYAVDSMNITPEMLIEVNTLWKAQ